MTPEEREEAISEGIDLIKAGTAMVASARSEDGEDPYVTGWALCYETTSVNLERDNATSDNVIVPDSQTRATSRGLLDLGRDHFLRAAFIGGPQS